MEFAEFTEGPWIQTYTGRAFHPLNPHPSEYCIEDIAHSLSLQCRFTGHVKRFYSVAEHSVIASYLVPAELALTALLHEIEEPYIGDVSRPLKVACPAIAEIGKRIEAVGADAFGLVYPFPAEIKEVDNRLLVTERDALMWPSPLGSGWPDVEPYPTSIIQCWSPDRAEATFIGRFHALRRLLDGPQAGGTLISMRPPEWLRPAFPEAGPWI